MSQRYDNTKKPKAARYLASDLKNLRILSDNLVQGLGSRRERRWSYVSVLENRTEKLPHLPNRTCRNFTLWFKEGSSWSIVVT